MRLASARISIIRNLSTRNKTKKSASEDDSVYGDPHSNLVREFISMVGSSDASGVNSTVENTSLSLQKLTDQVESPLSSDPRERRISRLVQFQLLEASK